MAPFDLKELQGRVTAGRSAVSSRFDTARSSMRSEQKLRIPPVSSRDELPPSTKAANRFSSSDKQALFSMLDSFFQPKNSAASEQSSVPVDVPVYVPSPVMATRPQVPSSKAAATAIPLRDARSEAAKTAEFFDSSIPWSTSPPWFAFDVLPPGSQPAPPHLLNRSDLVRSTSWSFRGKEKSLDGTVLFEDLSILWYHITWSDSRNPNTVVQAAKWSNTPHPWDGAELYKASETYGELVAGFAESAERERRHVGRGECWDLANDGLKYVASLAPSSGFPAPMPCIGKTHGHLIFSATAGSMGIWRGGENAIRRGDIVQWLSTTIKLAGQPLVTMTLGEPDHTAIVVTDVSVEGLEEVGGDGLVHSLPTSALGLLEVVEQSVRELPTRRTYDMSTFSKGTVWIYRPVSMQTYLGISEVAPSWPPPLPVHRLNG